MILSILKVMGIILLVILGLIIVILSLVLFVPIRYQFEGEYNERLDGDACVKWSPMLFKLSVSFHENCLNYVVKMFGGVVMTNTDVKISWIGKKFFSFMEEELKEDIDDDIEEMDTLWTKQNVKKNIIPEEAGEKESKDKLQARVSSEIDMEFDREEYDIESEKNQKIDKKKSDSVFDKIRNKIASWKKRWQNFIKKLKEICTKKDALLKVYRGKRFALAKQDVTRYIKEAFRIIKPNKLEGFVHFGMEDPAVTGQILGVLAMFLIFYYDFLTIQPDFTKSCLEGNVKGKGKIVVFLVVKLAIKVILNKNLIKVTKKVQTIIEA